MTNTKFLRKHDKEHNFISVFNPNTGFYVRSGVLDENGNDTGVDPFMASFAELIDVGIMGSCIHGSSGLCMKAGVQCYQNGLKVKKPNMSLEDYKSIVDQSKGKVYQIALGGRGDPNKHEQFSEICQYTRENDIVPNYTTSGLNLTDEEVETTKKYCGAVAVSWYRQQHTLDAIEKFIAAGMKTNIHYVLGNNTIDEAICRLENNEFPRDINAVIFLLHKPVGLGSKENMLSPNDERLQKFFSIVESQNHDFKIGFDSCTVPGILNYTTKISEQSVDTCEGARWSFYISSDMKALPCSFDNDEQKWAVDLKTNTLQEAWDSPEFEEFRNYFRKSCPSCSKRESCMGGCPIRSEIVLCEFPEKKPLFVS